MQLLPYLNFSGQCREAFAYYQCIFGGEIGVAMTYGDSPMAEQFSEEEKSQMMHMELIFDDIKIMGADAPSTKEGSSNVMLNLMVDTNEQAETIFERLSQDAQQVTQPMEETFWAHRFGLLVDQYGQTWMIMHGKPEN